MLRLNRSALTLLDKDNKKVKMVLKKHCIDLDSYEFGGNGNWVEFDDFNKLVRLDGVFTPFDLQVIFELLEAIQ